MQIAALVIAVVALLLALGARKRAAELSETLERALREQSGRAELLAEIQKGTDANRRFLELLAGNNQIDPLMVREKRLYRNVAGTELQGRFDDGEKPYVIDVRSDKEWAGGHLPGAAHIPIDGLEKRLSEVRRDGVPMYLICASGTRSAAAAELLANRGYLNVCNVEAGMNGWRGPVERA